MREWIPIVGVVSFAVALGDHGFALAAALER